MKKGIGFLTVIGIFCIFAVIIVGWIMFDLKFIVIGIILSLIVIGLGEILFFLQNKNDKGEK